ncbi:MAG: pentapeptide repeat-containing protein [Rhodothermales bacterium]
MRTAEPDHDIEQLLLDLREGRVFPTVQKIDLRNAVLKDRDLSGMNLAGADLSGADLHGANLSGAILFKANLQRANLMRANLNGAELSAADLTDADLEGAQAREVGLGMAILHRAHLFRADLYHATLTRADLTGADLRCADLQRTRLREARLGCDFTGADLREADLTSAEVSGASFVDVDFRHAILHAVTGYEKANWVGSDMRDVNFSGAYQLRRFAMDQNYIKEFRSRSRYTGMLYYLWWLTSDCGRSITRWCFVIAFVACFYAFLYSFVELDYGKHEPGWFSSLYYSVVTMTTLGFGDIVPISIAAEVLSMLEVLTGYIMLGGLLSIFSNKIARRAE